MKNKSIPLRGLMLGENGIVEVTLIGDYDKVYFNVVPNPGFSNEDVLIPLREVQCAIRSLSEANIIRERYSNLSSV